MELYRIYKSDLRESIKTAKEVAKKTGRSTCYHLVDFLSAVVMYGVGPIQYSKGSFYKLRSFDREKTYTKQRIGRLCKLFNDKQYMHIFKNKNEFNDYFKKYVSRDWVYCKTASVQEIEEFISRNDRILVKSVDGSQGIGIYELEKGQKEIVDMANALVGENVILEEFLKQHPQMCYGNKSVNTLRITTVLDKEGIAHIIKTSFRCGIGDTIIDNYHAGGVMYPINNQYGRIEESGLSDSLGDNIFIHPGTNYFMLGREIPFLREAFLMVQDAAGTIPQTRFVGWDVAILDTGPELIEGNTRPGADLMEFKGLEKGLYKKILSYL